MRRFFVCLALMVGNSGAASADGLDPNLCEWSTPLPQAEARVIGEGRAEFVHGAAFCKESAAKCRKPGYVLPGDPVLTQGAVGAMTCILFVGSQQLSSGWIPTARLQPSLPRLPALDEWTGDWTAGDSATITIKRHGYRLMVTGSALWQSHDERGHPIPGGVNTGELDANLVPDGNRLQLPATADYACEAELRLIGRRLFVKDNYQCGGVNVTFNGIYEHPAKRGARRR